LVNGTKDANNIAYVASLSTVNGKSFISNIHVYSAADEGKNADLVIPGVPTITDANNIFAYGFDEEAASGDVLSSINVGAVTGNFVTGLSGNGSSVLTSVTFGDAEQDSTRSWFVTGLEDNAVAVTAVSFGSVDVTPQTSAAVVSASVNNHVLSFSTGNFMTSATAALSGTGVTTKAFTKGGVKLSGFSSASDTLATGSVSQAATTVSYRSLLSKAVTLTAGTDTKYFFDKENADAFEAVMGYKSIDTTDADVTKSGAALSNTGITVTIPAETVAVGLNAGTLPTFTVNAATGTLTGSVDTSLTTEDKTWLAIDSEKMAATEIPGGYTLVSVSTGGVAVAEAKTYTVDGGHIDFEADAFIVDVKVGGTSV
jgi:hypothetical protein